VVAEIVVGPVPVISIVGLVLKKRSSPGPADASVIIPVDVLSSTSCWIEYSISAVAVKAVAPDAVNRSGSDPPAGAVPSSQFEPTSHVELAVPIQTSSWARAEIQPTKRPRTTHHLASRCGALPARLARVSSIILGETPHARTMQHSRAQATDIPPLRAAGWQLVARGGLLGCAREQKLLQGAKARALATERLPR